MRWVEALVEFVTKKTVYLIRVFYLVTNFSLQHIVYGGDGVPSTNCHLPMPVSAWREWGGRPHHCQQTGVNRNMSRTQSVCISEGGGMARLAFAGLVT